MLVAAASTPADDDEGLSFSLASVVSGWAVKVLVVVVHMVHVPQEDATDKVKKERRQLSGLRSA